MSLHSLRRTSLLITLLRIVPDPADLGYQGNGYSKIGRSGELAPGTANGVDNLVSIGLPLVSSDKQACLPKKVTAEFSIVADASGFNSRFLMEGDLGAWLLDDVGNLEGKAWAASNNGKIYVTPINCVIAEIEARTSKKVELF